MHCICCDRLLKYYEVDWCIKCIKASEDVFTKFKDEQHKLITDRLFAELFLKRTSEDNY